MAYRVNPALQEEVAAFGGASAAKCFNCGSCTAVCALSEGQTAFPRKMIRYLQLGLTDRLTDSPEPWLCYYCGTCSDTCPREAFPGEIMMALRRWLTSRYDWTGLSRRLYLSVAWEVGLLAVTALFVLGLFVVPGMLGAHFGFTGLGGAALQHVRLDLFARKDWVHIGDLVLAGLLALLLGINALRMSRFMLRGWSGPPAGLVTWVRMLPQLLIHGLTQKRWLECDNDTRLRWLQHLLLVTGYATMFLLVVAFLPWFQRDGSELHFTALFGYYGTAVLLGVTSLAMIGRLRKREAMHRFSHATDWIFLVLLFLTALSGILLHLFRLLDLPWPTYVTYVVHLMIAVPMLVIEVPFGKWLHLALRPVAVYVAAVRQAVSERAVVQTLAPSATAAATG